MADVFKEVEGSTNNMFALVWRNLRLLYLENGIQGLVFSGKGVRYHILLRINISPLSPPPTRQEEGAGGGGRKVLQYPLC